MANYGSSTNLGYIIASIDDSVSANLKAYALTGADNWINSKITGLSTTSPPTLIAQAAEYYAAVLIYRALYDVSIEETPTVVWWEETANNLLNSYIAQNPSAGEEASPYSRSSTPTKAYMERNPRTEEPEIDDHDYVSDEWKVDED